MSDLRIDRSFTAIVLLLVTCATAGTVRSQEKLLASYGGYNETMGPMWVGVDKGIFKKHGLDVSVLQVRNGQVSLTALISGDVRILLPAISSVLSGVSGGAKIGCVASAFNKITRELVVKKDIESLAGLRERTLGVQSIGGGLWLQTMIVLDRIGVDPEKNGLKMRVIGDEPTILQALLASNIDGAVLTYASAAIAKRAGLRSLVNTSELRIPYQGVGLCTSSDRVAGSPDVVLRLVKGLVDSVGFIHEPRNKREVMDVLKKNLRLSSDQDAETAYNSLLIASTLDVAPNPEAWRNIQKLVARVSPKVAQLDVNQIINGGFVRTLEDTGYLPEARKKLGL